MTTRYELFTAFDLSLNTFRLGGFAFYIENILQGNDINAVPIEILVDENNPIGPKRFLTLVELKADIEGVKTTIINLGNNINTVLTAASSQFLDNGLDFFSMDRNDIASDTSNFISLATDCVLIGITDKASLSILSIPFQSYTSKIVREVSLDEMSKEVINSNILNDVLDAMSYELQDRNSYSGQTKYYNDAAKIKGLIGSRIKVANVYLSNLVPSLDIDNMQSIVDYIDTNLSSASNLSELATLGQYINSNLTKLIMIRRHWVL